MRRYVSPSVRTLGFVILILGAWGAVLPFAGPSFGYPMPPGSHMPAWLWTASHAELHVAAGGAAFIGGALLLAGANRRLARIGGWIALLGGTWFVLGPIFSPAFLGGGGGFLSGPTSTFMRVVTPLGYHYGTGLVIVLLSALSLGVIARTRRTAAAETPVTAPTPSAPAWYATQPRPAEPVDAGRARERETAGTR